MVKKETQGHLCEFVATEGRMHKKFVPLLRKDGMGIDLSNVTFRWVDPNPDKKKFK